MRSGWFPRSGPGVSVRPRWLCCWSVVRETRAPARRESGGETRPIPVRPPPWRPGCCRVPGEKPPTGRLPGRPLRAGDTSSPGRLDSGAEGSTTMRKGGHRPRHDAPKCHLEGVPKPLRPTTGRRAAQPGPGRHCARSRESARGALRRAPAYLPPGPGAAEPRMRSKRRSTIPPCRRGADEQRWVGRARAWRGSGRPGTRLERSGWRAPAARPESGVHAAREAWPVSRTEQGTTETGARSAWPVGRTGRRGTRRA